MKHDVIYALSVLGVVGQVLIVLGLVIVVLALFGVRGPFDWIRGLLWGYELWGAFVVAAIATGGSLFYSQVAHFVPCEFCWLQRVCMYPLSIFTLLIAVRGDNRAARYILPLPIVGAGVSIYHMLIQYHAITEPQGCFVGVPGGCGVNWIAGTDFGYLSIPTLALTAFLLLIGFLVLASLEDTEPAVTPATLPAHAER